MMKGIQKGSKQSFKEAVFFGIFEEWVELINSGLLFCFVCKGKQLVHEAQFVYFVTFFGSNTA
jgi:hypothetical protein